MKKKSTKKFILVKNLKKLLKDNNFRISIADHINTDADQFEIRETLAHSCFDIINLLDKKVKINTSDWNNLESNSVKKLEKLIQLGAKFFYFKAKKILNTNYIDYYGGYDEVEITHKVECMSNTFYKIPIQSVINYLK